MLLWPRARRLSTPPPGSLRCRLPGARANGDRKTREWGSESSARHRAKRLGRRGESSLGAGSGAYTACTQTPSTGAASASAPGSAAGCAKRSSPPVPCLGAAQTPRALLDISHPHRLFGSQPLHKYIYGYEPQFAETPLRFPAGRPSVAGHASCMTNGA